MKKIFLSVSHHIFSGLSGRYVRENFHAHKHIRPFILSVLIFGLAIGIYQNVLNNYLADVLLFKPSQRGWTEFFRELPGLCLIAIFAILHHFTESKLIRLAFAISFFGMLGLAIMLESPIWGLLFVVVFSTGEHIVMPIRDSFAIHHAKTGREALAMGQTKSIHNLGLLLGFACVSLIFYLFRRLNVGDIFSQWHDTQILYPQNKRHWDFRFSYMLAALFLVIGFTLTWHFSERHAQMKRERFYFHAKYWKYYVLEVFFGARKQVFLTFGPYVLILVFGLKTEVLGLLLIINSILGIVLAPKFGRLIDYFGYKTMLIIDALLLIVLCLAYGFIPVFLPSQLGMVLTCGLFILDSLLFNFSSARNLYASTLGSREETVATLASGVSLNHLVSVVIAVSGGILWEQLGIQYLFSTAALFSLGSMIFCCTLPNKKLS